MLSVTPDLASYSTPIESASLGAWFADPQSFDQAQVNRGHVRRQLHSACAGSCDTFTMQLSELIASFWLDEPVEHRYLILKATATDWRAAMMELVYGQLLASRGLDPAMEHLDAGFRKATDFLSPQDYFTVMNRHDLLRLLPLFQEPRPPRSLGELLTEARIIRSLRCGRPISVAAEGKGVDISG